MLQDQINVDSIINAQITVFHGLLAIKANKEIKNTIT